MRHANCLFSALYCCCSYYAFEVSSSESSLGDVAYNVRQIQLLLLWISTNRKN